ncbi:hypothetical protein Hanom_Chr11g00973081 [Helianthus anomalus]
MFAAMKCGPCQILKGLYTVSPQTIKGQPLHTFKLFFTLLLLLLLFFHNTLLFCFVYKNQLVVVVLLGVLFTQNNNNNHLFSDETIILPADRINRSLSSFNSNTNIYR